jgi:SAM-dependent methyltransferase
VAASRGEATRREADQGVRRPRIQARGEVSGKTRIHEIAKQAEHPGIVTLSLETPSTPAVDRLRLSFGSVAEQYDRARPCYPDGLIDAVLDYGMLDYGDPMLDIGTGTGQAALQFAERGLSVLGIDPSAEMTDIANRKFAAAGLDARAVPGEFESAAIDQHAFKLICAATSWHWLDEERRFPLAARALAPGGTLAVLWTWPHWRGTTRAAELDQVYRAGGAPVAHLAPLYPHDPDAGALAREWVRHTGESGVFGDPKGKLCSWSVAYTARGFTDLLGTYGDHSTLEPGVREPLFAAVERMIEQCGGTIELPYTSLLLLART